MTAAWEDFLEGRTAVPRKGATHRMLTTKEPSEGSSDQAPVRRQERGGAEISKMSQARALAS